MSKLMRGLVLGAMLAVLSSATAAVAQEQSLSKNEAIRQYRAGERASTAPPVSHDQAVQQFRAGERASTGQLSSEQATQRALAQQRRHYYESTHPVAAPAQSAPDGQSDTPVVLLVALGAAAALALGLDAMSVRRKTRKAAHPAV
jgi:hypothetical protein